MVILVEDNRIELLRRPCKGPRLPLHQSPYLVRTVRLELTHLTTPEPKSGAAANYATSAILLIITENYLSVYYFGYLGAG